MHRGILFRPTIKQTDSPCVPLCSLWWEQCPRTKEHGLPRCDLRHTAIFWQKHRQSRAQSVPPAKYRYLSYFFGIPIGLTICVSAKAFPLIPQKISGFALTPDFAGTQERYVSAAG
jgi:hypothetical protein